MTKERKVKVLVRDDSTFPNVTYKVEIIETAEARTVIESHAHIVEILEDPVGAQIETAAEVEDDSEEAEDAPKKGKK